MWDSRLVAHLALQKCPDAGIALGQKCACIEHSCNAGEGTEVHGDRNAALILQPLACFLEQAFIACTAP